MNKFLKTIRVSIALVVLLSFIIYFIGDKSVLPQQVVQWVVDIQLVPSLLETLNAKLAPVIILAALVLLTMLIGRIYCSSLCPLGILQDLIIRLNKKLRRSWRFKHKRAHNILRYSLLTISIVFLLFGSLQLIILLDPYSNFGRILTNLLKPLVVQINNAVARTLMNFELYWLYPLNYNVTVKAMVYPLVFLITLVWLTSWRGRIFCNTLCPVGGLLSLFSKFSVYKLNIAPTSCTSCGRCMHSCKAECISLKDKSIDFSRCIACYNCISTCDSKSISYKKTRSVFRVKSKLTKGRRHMIARGIALGAGLIGFTNNIKAGEGKNIPQSTHPVLPPGSQNLNHFNETCTACHLCVAKCPANVLQPSLFEYGLANMLQPQMDYFHSYCSFDCTVCGEICPTGAILPLNTGEKHVCQVGKVQFRKGRCVVKTDGTACGSCSEHCPTQAVYMVPFKNHLTIPETNPDVCIGCGACEYACPVTPRKAIFVEANTVHQVADRPANEKLDFDTEADFPF